MAPTTTTTTLPPTTSTTGAVYVSPSPVQGLTVTIGGGSGEVIPEWDRGSESDLHHYIPSIERLESALEGYAGALLLITHDDTLAAAATTTTWSVGIDGVAGE